MKELTHPMSKYPFDKHPSGCPPLLLAPMEGVGDRPFRKAMATIGGFDEAVTEFIRVPSNAHVESLSKVYHANELSSIPLAAQIMGSDPELVAAMGVALESRGAPRIDLNCGCPSKIVTGKGAGSSLLKEPNHLHKIATLLVKAVNVPVTVKMRTGYEDTVLFEENLDAAASSGAAFITLHARTKKDGYSAPANWSYIAKAKQRLKIPIIGNGDILTVSDALRMLETTGCDGIMIGRGSVTDPFIFKRIKAHFEKQIFSPLFEDYCRFFKTFKDELDPDTSSRTQVNKLKQLIHFLFESHPSLQKRKSLLLTHQEKDPSLYLEVILSHIKECLFKT